jgi:putative peptidoglycan lipid II flippase
VAALAAWLLARLVAWPADLLGRLLQVGLGGSLGLLIYGALAAAARVPEAEQVITQLRRRLPGRLGGRR